MTRDKNIMLNNNEFLFTIIGAIMGISVLSIPNTAVLDAKQDGWIAAIMGSIYPFYVVFIASIIIRKYPETNIIELSKKYLGKIFGNILNIIFMAQFIYYAVLVISQGIHILITYAVWFMTPLKISLLMALLVVYGVTKGLKVLARINTLAFVFMSIVMMATLVAFRYGSFLNVRPVFGAGVGNIIKGSIDTAFAYANMELILVIHPYVKNKDKVIKLALISAAIITLYYTWSVFSTTLYFGPDIAPKSLWPFYFVTESVKIPVINNFRLVLMLIWPLIIYKSIATEYFMSTSIMDTVTGINYRKWCIFFFPLILFLPLAFQNEVSRRDFSEMVTPWITVFNLLYITLIALLVVIRNKSVAESKS